MWLRVTFGDTGFVDKVTSIGKEAGECTDPLRGYRLISNDTNDCSKDLVIWLYGRFYFYDKQGEDP
jgi:hypothetical protein